MAELKELLEEFDSLFKEITAKADNPTYHTDYDLLLISKIDSFIIQLEKEYPDFYKERNFPAVAESIKSILSKCLESRKSKVFN